jgi:hypothetical protein
VAGIVIAVLALRKSDDTTAPSHIVIDDRRDLATPTPAPDAAPAIIEVDAGVTAKPIEPAKPLTQAELLERTFAKRKSELAACARAHPEGRGENLTMRFQIDTQGKVINTELLPAQVAATPLGACLTKIARATTFGPQPKGGTTFRIPLNVD